MVKSNHQAPKSSKVPTELCQECLQQKPRYGFTNLFSQEGKPSESLCAGCYNRRLSKHWNIPELETVEFSPLTFHDSLGKGHTFHFDVRISAELGIKAFE